VQDRERARDVAQQRARLAPRQLAALAQIRAVEQLHRVVRAERVDAVVVDLDDAGMLELRERVVLALEQRGEHAPRELVADVQPLERKTLSGALVEHAIDRAHRAAPELALGPKAAADHGAHLSGCFD
jgi:hypothetical protein